MLGRVSNLPSYRIFCPVRYCLLENVMNALLCHLKLAWPLSWECVQNMALHAAHGTLPWSKFFHNLFHHICSCSSCWDWLAYQSFTCVVQVGTLALLCIWLLAGVMTIGFSSWHVPSVRGWRFFFRQLSSCKLSGVPSGISVVRKSPRCACASTYWCSAASCEDLALTQCKPLIHIIWILARYRRMYRDDLEVYSQCTDNILWWRAWTW